MAVAGTIISPKDMANLKKFRRPGRSRRGRKSGARTSVSRGKSRTRPIPVTATATSIRA